MNAQPSEKKNAPTGIPANLVIGDGWAAMAAVALLATKSDSETVHWMPSKASRLFSPLASLEAGPASALWETVLNRVGLTPGPARFENSLREFRGKSFRHAPWSKIVSPEERAESRLENLWEGEAAVPPLLEARFDESFVEQEQELRARLLTLPNVHREEGLEVTGFEVDPLTQQTRVLLLNGETRQAPRVIFADRWSLLSSFTGMPKPVPMLRKREMMGAVQVVFTHRHPMASDVTEGFYTALHKDAGEDFQRQAWGHFFAGGEKSVWTVLLEPDFTEDNHEIGKKYRRLKQALDRMFVGEPWLRAGEKDFSSTVASEQLHFEERFLFSMGGKDAEVLREPVRLKELPGMVFVSDGWGPSVAVEMVARLLESECDLNAALAAQIDFSTAVADSAEESSGLESGVGLTAEVSAASDESRAFESEATV